MKFRKVLVALGEGNCSLTYFQSDVSDLSDRGTRQAASLHDVVRFTTSPGAVGGFANSRYFYPACTVAVSVPDDDVQLVKAWLGATVSQPLVPGETLVKRMTNGALGTFKRYQQRAELQNLFTSPFVAGYALRRADGSHFRVSPFVRKVVCSSAPLMTVNELTFSYGTLQSVTEFQNTPVSLAVDIDPFTLDDGVLPSVTHLDIYLGKPVDLFDGGEQVSAIRTEQIAGENRKIWAYDRLSENVVMSRLATTSDFRVVASIPIGEAMAGVKGMSLPAAGFNLGEWDKLPKLAGDAKPGDAETPEELYDRKRVVTAFLDLGGPEAEKRVRGVTARGIFERRHRGLGEEITMELLGSHHRDVWHKVARSRGPHLRLLRGAAYRWWQVRMEMDAGSKVDYLVFEIK